MKFPILYTLLYFVPIVGMIMPFIYWIKGNEWAWKYRSWDSVEHFQRVQASWTKVGVILLIILVILHFILFQMLNNALQSLQRV